MISPAQQSITQSTLAPATLANNVSMAVAAKALNAQRQQGADIQDLLDDAASDGPQPGDSLVAKATGLGSLLDMTA